MNALKYPNIEAERVRAGMSQDELIEKLGYKERKTYYNWLSSGSIPTSVLIMMSDIFRCSIDYLLGRAVPTSKPKEETHERNDSDSL